MAHDWRMRWDDSRAAAEAAADQVASSIERPAASRPGSTWRSGAAQDEPSRSIEAVELLGQLGRATRARSTTRRARSRCSSWLTTCYVHQSPRARPRSASTRSSELCMTNEATTCTCRRFSGQPRACCGCGSTASIRPRRTCDVPSSWLVASAQRRSSAWPTTTWPGNFYMAGRRRRRTAAGRARAVALKTRFSGPDELNDDALHAGAHPSRTRRRRRRRRDARQQGRQFRPIRRRGHSLVSSTWCSAARRPDEWSAAEERGPRRSAATRRSPSSFFLWATRARRSPPAIALARGSGSAARASELAPVDTWQRQISDLASYVGEETSG